MLFGGWKINENLKKNTSFEQPVASASSDAVLEYTGVKIEIIDLLADQIVNGANYAFLAYVSPTVVDINANKHLAVVIVHAPNGVTGEGAKVLSIETLF